MKIAVVGTGISGLVAARELTRDHEVDVFEAAAYAGGHTNTVDVVEDGRTLAIDTGFIVFNERTYPNFCRLLGEHRQRQHRPAEEQRGEAEQDPEAPDVVRPERDELNRSREQEVEQVGDEQQWEREQDRPDRDSALRREADRRDQNAGEEEHLQDLREDRAEVLGVLHRQVLGCW